MEMKIEIMPPYNIAYIRGIGPYGNNNIDVMEKLKEFTRIENLLDDDSIILGIAQDNPEKTKPENCRYDACLVISEDISIKSDSINIGRIIGGLYAVFTVDHTVEALGRAWSEIFPILFNHDYQIDESRPIVERYINRMIKKHKCEICVPIN